MNTPEITVKRREGTGKGVARRLRRAGAVPAILYGGATPQTITVNPRDVLRIIHGHEGTTQLLSLKVEGDGGARMAIIRDMQFDPVTEKLVHVDIQEVRAERKPTEEGARAEAEGKKAPVAAAAKKPEAPKKAEKEK